MKFLVIFGAVLAMASAQVQYQRYNRPFAYSTPRPLPPSPRPSLRSYATNEAAANTLSYENDIQPDGAFRYAYQTDNSISAAAEGVPRNFGGNPPLVPVVINGNYAYTSPEGIPISISYIADENGYQAQGDSIPTPPPIPPLIARALEYIARNGQKK